MHHSDYRLAKALQERRLEDSARHFQGSQDGWKVANQLWAVPPQRVRRWLFELGGFMIDLGVRLGGPPVAIQSGSEQSR